MVIVMNGMNRLDIKQLRVLQALLDLQNLSQVARKMGLTQQAISEQLRKLRDLFDDRLFIRQGNSMVATPKALAMRQPIDEILKQLEVLLEPEVFTPQTYKASLRLVQPTMRRRHYCRSCLVLHAVKRLI